MTRCRFSRALPALVLAGSAWLPTQAAQAADVQADARDIAALLHELEQATNTRDIPRLLRHAAPDIVVVSKNGEMLAGKQALAGYLEKMIGAAPSLREIRSRVLQDGPPLFAGDMAIAAGRSEDIYVFTTGLQFDITTTWSAALVRQPAGWRIASLHFSFNLFDNPMLDAARTAARVSAGVALLAGLALGLLAAWVTAQLRRHRR